MTKTGAGSQVLATLAIATFWHPLHTPDLVVWDQLIGDFIANEHVTEARPAQHHVLP